MIDNLLGMHETLFISHHCKIIKIKKTLINNENSDYYTKSRW